MTAVLQGRFEPVPIEAGPQAAVDPGPPPAPGRSGRARTVLGHLVLGTPAIACVTPIYWLFATSLRRPGDVYDLSIVPWPLSVQNYVDAWHTVDIGRLMFNTAVVSLLGAAGQLLVALLAAYALVMWRFALRSVFFALFIGTWLVPFQVTMLPNYVALTRLHLLDTLAGVILPTLCSAVGVLLLRQHLRGFPRELVEAAHMDGLSSWKTLWTVVVPNLRPALVALGLLLFVTTWNEYFWPAMVLRGSNAMLQPGIRSFMGTEGNDWGPLMATAGLACLPVLALYLFLQRHIVNAFVRSGLK